MPTEKDASHYNMQHRRRGKAYIFNHMNFDPAQQLRPRNGTDADRDNLRVCLRQLDFEVEVFNDLPVKEIDRVLESAALEDHSDADCLLVAGEQASSERLKRTHGFICDSLCFPDWAEKQEFTFVKIQLKGNQ